MWVQAPANASEPSSRFTGSALVAKNRALAPSSGDQTMATCHSLFADTAPFAVGLQALGGQKVRRGCALE
jgi:hypothetical protein